MAELNVKQAITSKKGRVRKAAPKVDLTAMVDLAFLLITFFMLTTSLNKPHSLDVAVPDNTNMIIAEIDERRLLSLVIQEGQLIWYHGDVSKPLQKPASIDLNNTTLRDLLLNMRDKIKGTTGDKDMIVLIKPSKEARAIDIIQVLDEMKISNIKRYMLSKATTQDEAIVL